MHIVEVVRGKEVEAVSLCGLPMSAFKDVPLREDRLCQKCLMVQFGLANPTEFA